MSSHTEQRYETGLNCHYCYRKLIFAETPTDMLPYYQAGDNGSQRLDDSYGVLTTDHKHAQSLGGGDGTYNRVPCCKGCNQAKGARSYAEFYAETSAIRAANQLTFALEIIKQHIGYSLIADGALISTVDYSRAKRVIKRAVQLHTYKRYDAQAVQYGR